MRKLFLILLFIPLFTLSADWFYFPSEYNAVYNDKVALEIELSRLKTQFSNDKTALENEIKTLQDRISFLEKMLKLEKEGRADDRESFKKQIEDLNKRISILKSKGSERERELINQNNQLEKDYLAQIEDLKKKLEEEKASCIDKMEAMKKDFAQKSALYENQIAELTRELSELKNLTAVQKRELDRLSDQAGELEKQLQNEIKNGEIRLKRAFNKLTINIDDKISFDSGSADLKPGIKNALDKIAQILSDYPENNVVVEGHTDNVPIKTARFRDNWQLSTERALSVLGYLLKNKKINPQKVSVAGMGEFQPIVPNDTAENKSLNRRVDIVVVPRVKTDK